MRLRFPKNDVSRQFLFRAARLAESHGSPDIAARRFSAYAARYPVPVWMWTYGTLYVGLAAGQRGDSRTSLRLLEEGLRKVDAGGSEEFPREVAELAGRAHIAVGENWAEQFRKTRLVVPLEKSLAIKDRFFRLALGAFAKAERVGTLELSLQASRLSGRPVPGIREGDPWIPAAEGADGERPGRIRGGVEIPGEVLLRAVGGPVRRRAGAPREGGRHAGPGGAAPETAGGRAGSCWKATWLAREGKVE